MSKNEKSREIFFAIFGAILGLFGAIPTTFLIFDRFFQIVPSIEFSALDRINGEYPNVAASPYPRQIGMLHNRVVDTSAGDIRADNAERPNEVSYVFEAPRKGTYKFRILYASVNERSIDVYVNSFFITNTLKDTTPCWDNKCRTWSPPLCVRLNAGENSLKLKRATPFPHLSRMEFIYESHCG